MEVRVKIGHVVVDLSDEDLSEYLYIQLEDLLQNKLRSSREQLLVVDHLSGKLPTYLVGAYSHEEATSRYAEFMGIPKEEVHHIRSFPVEDTDMKYPQLLEGDAYRSGYYTGHESGGIGSKSYSGPDVVVKADNEDEARAKLAGVVKTSIDRVAGLREATAWEVSRDNSIAIL